MSLSRSFISLLGPGLAIALAIWRPSILGEADLRIYDALVRADAAVTDTGTRAVVVAIDEASLARAGQWPWPRAVLATLVDQLHALGASVIALDLLLPEAERGAAATDRALARCSEPGARRHRLRVPVRSAGPGRRVHAASTGAGGAPARRCAAKRRPADSHERYLHGERSGQGRRRFGIHQRRPRPGRAAAACAAAAALW